MSTESITTYMFHYIKNPRKNALTNLNYFDSEKFFSFVEKNKEHIFCHTNINKLILSPEDLDKSKKILLTFDDGLKEHYEEAYQVLKFFKVSGIFFINSNNIITGKMDTVHKVHFLYGKLGWKKVINLILKECKQHSIKIDKYFEEDKAKKSYPLDKNEVANIKFALNYNLEPEIRDKLINKIFEKNRGVFLEHEFYLSRENITKMSENKMIFGFHGHEHIPFSNLDDTELESSILKQKKFFSELNLENCSVLSFPYGDHSSYNRGNLDILKKIGVTVAFTADHHTTIKHPLTILKRTDCAVL